MCLGVCNDSTSAVPRGTGPDYRQYWLDAPNRSLTLSHRCSSKARQISGTPQGR